MFYAKSQALNFVMEDDTTVSLPFDSVQTFANDRNSLLAVVHKSSKKVFFIDIDEEDLSNFSAVRPIEEVTTELLTEGFSTLDPVDYYISGVFTIFSSKEQEV